MVAQAPASTLEFLTYLSSCKHEKGKAGTKGKSSKSQKKGSLFGVTLCIQAVEEMKGSVLAASFLVPGIGLPPEEQRRRDAVTTYSCLFMFILKRHVSGAARAAYGKGNGSQGNN